MQDQEEPRSSHDTSAGSFHWWPKKGTTEWVQYDLEKPSSVSAAEVYWLDDTGSGDVRVPATWRVLYKDGNDWKPVEAAAPGGVALDRYNRLTFKPVTTSANDGQGGPPSWWLVHRGSPEVGAPVPAREGDCAPSWARWRWRRACASG